MTFTDSLPPRQAPQAHQAPQAPPAHQALQTTPARGTQRCATTHRPAAAPRIALRWLLAMATLLIGIGLMALPAAAQAPGLEVSQLRLERADDGIYLSATVRFDLPQGVEEVLDKGVAVYFVAEAELYRERWYWSDRKVAQAARHMRLAYQPLTRRWRVNASPVSITQFGVGVALNQNFDTLAEALGAIKRIGRLRLADVGDIAADEPTHPVVFRFRLDNAQLPRPFQIGVAGQSDWNLAVERSVRLPLEPVK